MWGVGARTGLASMHFRCPAVLAKGGDWFCPPEPSRSPMSGAILANSRPDGA